MKALVIGLGGVGQRHVRNLRALVGPELELIAYRVRRDTPVLTDRLTVEVDANLETKYGIRTYTDLSAALAERPGVALVCNPTSLHLETACAAAEAGCHLLIEKPLSHDLVGVDDLISTVERKGVVALVAYQWRFHPLLTRVRALLEAGALGQIAAVQAEIGELLTDWHPYEDYRRMYAARRDQGGGVVLTQSHEMDYLLWLFGAPSRIFAIGGRRSTLDIDVEDTAAVLMEVNGFPVQLSQDYIQRPARRRLRIVGDKGNIVADLLAPRLQVFRRGELIEDARFEGFSRNDMFLNEMRHFLDCVAGRASPLISLREGAISLRMAMAALESIATGEPVALS
jgi:predicted dehydrogenase